MGTYGHVRGLGQGLGSACPQDEERKGHRSRPAPIRGEKDERALQNSEINLQKALLAANAALDKKALEPALLDISKECSYADFLLIVSARSDRQVRAVAENVVEKMVEAGYRPLGVEGVREGRWALVDFGDVVVHVFYHPVREFYDLESMWVDARQVPLQVPPDQRILPHQHFGSLDDEAEAVT